MLYFSLEPETEISDLLNLPYFSLAPYIEIRAHNISIVTPWF